MARRNGPNQLLLRRSPYLLLYWDAQEAVIYNYVTHVRVPSAPIVLAVLELFKEPRRMAELMTVISAETREAFRDIVDVLTERTLLERFDSAAKARDCGMRLWDRWGPEAKMFHWATKDVKFISPEELTAFDERRKSEFPAPASSKHYPKAKQIALSLQCSQLEAKYVDVLHARRTHRAFDARPITMLELSTLLRLTWGVDKWVSSRTFGSIGLKTSPSGGARYPIEVYVAAQNVEGLNAGLYHYSPDQHLLHVLRLGPIKDKAEAFCGGQWWTASAGALFFMTAVFERTMWLYDFSRALRVIYMEAGHFCQTFCLTATALNLAPFCTAAIADSLIERELGLDGIKESVLYVAAAGRLSTLETTAAG